MTDLHLLLLLFIIIIIIIIFIPKGVHGNPGIPRVPGILVLPLLPCCQPTSCSISNLIPRVFHIYIQNGGKRKTLWYTAGHMSSKILEILINSKWWKACYWLLTMVFEIT